MCQILMWLPLYCSLDCRLYAVASCPLPLLTCLCEILNIAVVVLAPSDRLCIALAETRTSLADIQVDS